MKCKICGYETESRIRFCPECQSYFVDANDPNSGSTWKGVIGSDGQPAEQTKVQKTGALAARPRFVWALISLITAVINLILVILTVYAQCDFLLECIAVLCVSIVTFIIGAQNKLSWYALLLMILAVILFVFS